MILYFILILFAGFYGGLISCYMVHVTPEINGNTKIVPGASVVLKVQYEGFNLTNCSLTPPRSNQQINLVPHLDVGRNLSYWGEGFDKGECGALIKDLSKDNTGIWVLNMDVEGLGYQFKNFYLQIEPVPELDRNSTQYLNETKSGVVVMGSNVSTYCQGTHPNKSLMPLMKGQCKYEIDKVQLEDAGTWKAKYKLYSLTTEIEDEVEVVVRPAVEIEAHVQQSFLSKEYTDVFCDLYSLEEFGTSPMDYCYFTLPGKKTLYLDPGLGYLDMLYHGNGIFYSRKIHHCGITFLRPLKTEEIGTWNCSFGRYPPQGIIGEKEFTVK